MHGVDIRHIVSTKPQRNENPRTLWKTINNILHRTQSPSIPAFSDIKSISESFSKIEKIRMNFSNDVHNMPDIKSPTVKSRMTCFEIATADEVGKLVINSPSKPSAILMSCLHSKSHLWQKMT